MCNSGFRGLVASHDETVSAYITVAIVKMEPVSICDADVILIAQVTRLERMFKNKI
jgi:hypothetical protein